MKKNKKAKKAVKKTVKKVVAAKKFVPTTQQKRALRRSTSFGVVFERRKAITQYRDENGNLKSVRSPGRVTFTSARRFGSENEAKRHGKRFMRLENHRSFKVITVKLAPNAWVNLRTGKTNPVIGRGRKNRR